MKHLISLAALLIVAAGGFAEGQRESGDFRYDSVTSLQVEAETFSVEASGIRGRHVEMEIENYPDDYTVYHSVDGNRVRVWVEKNFSLFGSAHRARLVFRVPPEIDLTVDTSTGDVSVSRLTDGSLSVETSTGSISLDEVENDVRARSTTGGMDIRRCEGDLSVRSTTGTIRIASVQGDVDVESTTGAQRLERIEGDVDARSTTGRVEVNDTRGRLFVKTSTGNQVGRDVTVTGDSTFEATTGSIEMDLTNDLDQLEFDLTSTTGSLRVGDDRSQRRLFLGGTGITVKGSTSTGSQRFY